MTTQTATANLTPQKAIVTAAYTTHRQRVWGYIVKRIGHAADAEDLTQELFLRLMEQTTLLSEQTLIAYIYSIAHNLVIDYLRRHARSQRAAAYFAVHAPRSTRNTEEQVAVNELEALEAESVARMPRRKAEVYLLYIHEHRSVDEIALTLGLSRRTVENHIFAARIDLRTMLREAL